MTIYQVVDHAKAELDESWDELQCAYDLDIASFGYPSINTHEATVKHLDAVRGFQAITQRPEENQRCIDWADVENEIGSGRY